MGYNFSNTDKVSINELDESLKFQIGLIDGMSGDLDNIYPGATKVENLGGGKIKINDVEYVVYSHPSTHSASMISGLHTVATSGKYSDLIGSPESLPASDVYDWAKAATKPSYNASEVNAIPLSKLGVVNGVAELNGLGKVPTAQCSDNLYSLIEDGVVLPSQVPMLEITEKLTDNQSKILILGCLNAATLARIPITLEELTAEN